ncbi:unnamed protein product, partial [Ectocarpus fasciculatus]
RSGNGWVCGEWVGVLVFVSALVSVSESLCSNGTTSLSVISFQWVEGDLSQVVAFEGGVFVQPPMRRPRVDRFRGEVGCPCRYFVTHDLWIGFPSCREKAAVDNHLLRRWNEPPSL